MMKPVDEFGFDSILMKNKPSFFFDDPRVFEVDDRQTRKFDIHSRDKHPHGDSAYTFIA